MVRLERRGKDFALVFSEAEAKAYGLDEAKGYGIVKAKEDVLVLLGKEKPLEARILELLEATPLEQRVEGKFEKHLSKEMLPKFKELLKAGVIVSFKLSPKYKKAIYKSLTEVKSKKMIPRQLESSQPVSSKSINDKQQAMPNSTTASLLEKEGFQMAKNQGEARQLSAELEESVRNGEVKGIKSFDGVFYIIKSDYYSTLKEKLLPFIAQKKETSVSELVQSFKLDKDLVKAVCEFLKDEGEVSERRKEIIKYVP